MLLSFKLIKKMLSLVFKPTCKIKYLSCVIIAISLSITFGNIGIIKAQTPAAATAPSEVKADNLNDGQVRDLMQKAQASGMSDEQIRQAALAKGMPEAEVNKLQARINIIRTSKDDNAADKTKKTNGRQVNGDDKTNPEKTDTEKANNGPRSSASTIFGSELFNNDNLTFEPNLRIPTPQNYKLGPDDQIVINVYGNSQVDWRLNVTPEGNIQIPGIGLVNVSGKTIEQSTALIKSKLIQNHYAIGHGTNVAVSLGNIRSIKVILVGELNRPGTYTLSSLSTVFNALYASGGPSGNGSFRQIEIIRDNAVIRKLDVYDFLLKGSQKDNIKLEDGDIIRVPTYKVRVSLSGQVKRPAIYEVIPGESLRDVINFGGGFSDLAYTATIKVLQVTDQDRRVTDIKSADFNNYIPLRSDQYEVERILDTYENRVSIYGAVIRPGQFELSKGLTLTQLITKASGLLPDAFTSRGFISRLKIDNTTELISFDVKAVLNKTNPDITLKKEDVVSIPSIFDLRDQYKVTVNGEVRTGGDYSYAENMTVEDIIVQAGGFTEGASPKRIAVARRIKNSDPNQKNTPVAEVFTVDVDDKFKLNNIPFKLEPFDVVSVYNLPGYEKQKTVRIEGEVLYPGTYTLSTKDEKISSLVKRAGGLTISADVEAGSLKRIDNMGVDVEKSKLNVGELQSERYQRLEHLQKTLKDSTNSEIKQLNNEYIGVDLKKILKKPNSKIDLILQEGDVLRVPKEQQTVKVRGEVLFPSSVVFDNSKSFRSYINNSGGFAPNALKRRSYVLYSNGTVASTHNYFFFNSFPRIKSGSELVVPKSAPSKRLSVQEIAGISGALASAAAVLIGVLSLVRR